MDITTVLLPQEVFAPRRFVLLMADVLQMLVVLLVAVQMFAVLTVVLWRDVSLTLVRSTDALQTVVSSTSHRFRARLERETAEANTYRLTLPTALRSESSR